MKSSRRLFLKQILNSSAMIGIAGVSSPTWSALTSHSTSLTRSNSIENLSTNASDKLCPSHQSPIKTRLFSSSGVIQNDQRSKLALSRLRCAGFDIQNEEIIQRQFLRFAGTDEQRVNDLQNIATGGVSAPKLLLATRGGYGAMRLLNHIDWASLGQILKEKGTILAGYSDVTAVQCALLAKGGMCSFSAPMLHSDFGREKPSQFTCQSFIKAISEPNLTIQTSIPDLTSSALPCILSNNAQASISGTIWGGNLSVLSALAGTPFLPKPDGGIVFLEDVGEQSYQIERMLYHLYLSGVFKNQQAIVFGALSNVAQDGYDVRYNINEVIQQLHKITKLPVYSGFAFGHIIDKVSFPLGVHCTITPQTHGGFAVQFFEYPIIKYPHNILLDGLLGSITPSY